MHPPFTHSHRNEAAVETAADAHPALTFFRQWLHDPVKVAAVSPSGRQLATLMVAQLPQACSRVIELGAGTGVFTGALLDAGIEPSQLLVVEINAELAALLRHRFPGVAVACADARNVDALATQYGLLTGGRPGAVVSGLGMLLMDGALRCEMMRAAFAVLGRDGRFIQFTYGPFSPVRRRECEALGLRMRRAGVALRNVPPAKVYVYERRRSHEIASVRQVPGTD